MQTFRPRKGEDKIEYGRDVFDEALQSRQLRRGYETAL